MSSPRVGITEDDWSSMDATQREATGRGGGGRTDPIRILTFSTLYPNEMQPSHGVFVENRLRHLVASGAVEAVVVAPVPYFPSRSSVFGRWSDYAKVPKLERRNGLIVHHPRYPVLPAVGMTFAPAHLAAGSLRTIGRLRRSGYDFDLIDAHYVYPDGVAATWLGMWFRKPVVVTARGTDVNYIPRFRLPRRLIQHSLARAAGIITVSQALKKATVRLGIAPNNITVLRNGVDLERFRPLDRSQVRLKLGISGMTLLSVGHLIERKGHDLVIEALARLTDFQLVIVGEGPARSRLEALAQSLGVATRVRLVGTKQHDELAQYYTAADALVLASSREGWANVLLEAMACGTPVVASNVWGNPEVVGARAAGQLMGERTPSGIVAAVRHLFANLPDRDETRRYAEKFSWDETTGGQLRLFRDILSRTRIESDTDCLIT
jgi:teichuronic acid biosynthesis glycosyltransferase TuaC